MSTVDRLKAQILPDLVDGQRLDQPTFHERYAAMPSGTRAELIGGIVHMASPLFDPHGGDDLNLAGWLFYYEAHTPGLRGVTNTSTILDDQTEVQPDLQLRRLEGTGGRARVVDGYVVGPPELVVEVGNSSRSHDLGTKKDRYEAAGVLEYLFVGLEPREVRWFLLRGGRFERLASGVDGLIRSETFPGLWLDVAALFNGDKLGLLAALNRGLATPQHADFVAHLARV